MFLKYKYQIYLCLIVLLCYWPLTFFQTTLLNDDIDVALATKYFAGTCLQNGQLPLWNPYQIFGFPAHADLQYVNWNIETLVVGILNGYDYITLHLLFLFYLIVGAFGMFMLGKHFSKNDQTAFYIGVIYILSGLVSAHVQSLVTILGIVWIPYVIVYFVRWLNNPNLRSSALLSVFFYLFFTLGYQAFAFMLLPILATLLIAETIKNFKQRNTSVIIQHAIWGITTIIFLIVLFSPILVTQLQTKPFVARLNGMSVDEVMSNPFSPYGLISLLNPILTIGNDELFNTDISMRNIYIGLIPLVLLIVSLFKKHKTGIDYILLAFSLFYLLGSFGDILPVRKLMYYTLPGFNLFRFPSLIKVLVMVCLLIYLTINFKTTITLFFENKKIRWISTGVILISTLCLLVFSFSQIEAFTFFNATGDSFNNRVKNTSSYEIAFYLSLFQLVLFTVFIIAFKKANCVEQFTKQLIGISVLEFAITICIYGQYLSFTNVQPAFFQDNFKNLQTNFPFPSKDPIKDNDVKFSHITGFWKNTGSFKKQLSAHDEWTSFLFTNYNNLTDKHSSLKDTLISYPFIYFSKPNKTEFPITTAIDSSTQFVNASFHYKNADAEITYKSYSPNYLAFECLSKENVILNLQQTYFTGWKVTVDGKEAPLLWNASLLMSVAIPKGNHHIEFQFTNNTFEYSLIFSYGLFILLVITIIFYSHYKQKNKFILATLFLGLCILTFILFFSYRKNSYQKTQNTFIFNGETSKPFELNFTNKEDVRKFLTALQKSDPETIGYTWNNYYNSPEIALMLNASGEINYALNGELSYKKSNYNPTILFSEKFDAYFKNKQFIDSTDNTYSLILNSKVNPYSYSADISKKVPQSKAIFGHVIAKSLKDANPIVVCSIKHTNGKEDVLYFALNKYLIPNSSFQLIPYYFDTNNKILDDDNVSVFIMNQNEGTAFIKEFKGSYHP